MGLEYGTVKTESFMMDWFSFGKGKIPFIIIPGIGISSILEFADAVANEYSAFTKKYKLYCFDRKRNISGRYTIEDMADDTAAAMKSLGIRNAYGFGASQGGMILLCLAAKYGDLIKAAAVCSTAVRSNKTMNGIFIKWRSALENGDIKSLKSQMFSDIYSKEYLKKYGGLLLAANTELSDADKEKTVSLIDACLEVDLYGILENVKCRTFVLGSKKDAIFTANANEEIAEKLGCESYIYEGYSHAVYDEAPDFINRLYDFFEGVK